MIETILNIAKMLLAILPFILLCLLSKKVNLPKVDRSKQYFMPIFTVIYAVVTMFFVNRINTGLINFVESIPAWIQTLGDVSWMPDKIGAVITSLGKLLADVIAKLNLNFWVCFISNAAIILGYIVLKRIIITFMAKLVKTDGRLHSAISGCFYEYFAERNKWCIKDNYVQVRSMFKMFYILSVILSAILMLVSRKFYFDGLIRGMFYPVFGILIVGELYFYLDGATRKEYLSDILGEDEEAYKTVNYSLLRKFLRSVFGDKLLAENTSVNNALAYDVTTQELIEELENSDDNKVVCFGAYINALNKTGVAIDHNYLRSSLDLLNGKSILFNNPFYNDLIPYAFYPMNRALLQHKKVLVVLGRHTIEDDIKDWIERGIGAVTNIPFMWQVGVLSSEAQNLDIGIVTRSDVLNIELHNANSEFLENVGYVVIIEPSKLISTAQIGLNLLVKKCKTQEDKEIVYCVCDKNCDGLVDALSHALMTSFTEVSATRKHLGTSSYMCWEADDEYLHHRLVPNISRYLGVGTELSFAALKNQVSKTKWYGGEAFPVTDLRWISKQYYYDLTRYASLPTTPDALDEHFETTPNFWSAEVSESNYLTVEDESYNMFEVLREFSTRSTEQGFINIVSPEYLLKDYMADNSSIFEADAKAIPCIVADYTRSNRNTILRLILKMSTYPVRTHMLEKELSLLGIGVFDLKKQLWYELYNCYASVDEIAELPQDYRMAVNKVFAKTLRIDGMEWTHRLIQNRDIFNIHTGQMEPTYYISDSKFMARCVAELRSAGYVAEDERGQRYYLGAELAGQVYQKYLPGQFFTFGGKYYEMQYLTADGQVLVRRAADHINGRPDYRQIRQYAINGVRESDKIGAKQDIGGMKIIKEFADITVSTPGYYRMKKYNDFETAKRVSFEGERNGIPKRTYCNKEILRIELPDFGGKYTDNVRYTITLLFNEVFRTIFAENQAFICAVTDDSFIAEDEANRPLTYSVKGDGYEIQKNAIYIIEDSQLDLGLTVAVERNLERIFNIIYDYLDWHMETLEASLNPPPEPVQPIEFEGKHEDDEKKEKKGFFAAIGRFFKRVFGRKDKKPEKAEPKPEETTGGDGVTPEGTTPEGEKSKKMTRAERKAEKQRKKEENKNKTRAERKAEKKAEKQRKKEEKKKLKEEKKKQKAEEKQKRKESGEKRGIFGWFKRKKKVEEPTGDGAEIETTIEEPTASEGDEPADGEADDNTDADESAQADGEENPADNADDATDADDTADEPDADEAADVSEDETTDEAQEEEIESDATEEGVAIATADLSEAPPAGDELAVQSDSDNANRLGFSTDKRPYHQSYYLLYGRSGEASFIDVSSTLSYMAEMGMQRNPLKQAREGKKIAEYIEATYKPGKPDARYCDFCGAEIYGVEYETLLDGRNRCMHCGRTAVKTAAEFRKLFEDVKRNMEAFFSIRINVGIKVEMVNSKTLHKRLGKSFVPSPKSDGRVLGVAIKDRNGYTLMVENGSPRMATMLTVAHELTHIWQYANWDRKAIRKKYGKKFQLEVYEGMAKWVEIQYAYLINEPATAKREEIITSIRDDEYGRGFLRYRANYPFSLGTVITKPTPFMYIDTPLHPDYCGEITVPQFGDGDGDEGGNGGGSPTGGKNPNPVKGPTERTPGAVNMYAYSLLSDDEKAAYDAIVAAVKGFEPKVESFGAALTEPQLQKIVDFVCRDHPELFWFQHGATIYFNTETNEVTSVDLIYCMSQEEANARQEEINTAVAEFLDGVRDDMSDYEATLHIYENIIKRVDYDTIGLERQKKSKTVAPDVPDDLRSIYGVFVNKRAVCAGYAKAFQFLLNACGIECIYVTSTTHAWNIIKLEGDYYHVDITWGDGSNTRKEMEQLSALNYDFFCITTEDVLRLEQHEPESKFPIPTCTATKCNYHKRNGLFFDSFSYDRVRDIVCESVKQDKLEISLKFVSQIVFNEAKQALIDGGKFREAIQYAGLKADVRLDLSYKYVASDERLTMTFFITKR